MTDNYERMSIDGKKYVLIPEDQWEEEQVDTQTQPNPAWFDFMLADDSPISTQMGLYSNILLPLGHLMRLDDKMAPEKVPTMISRSLRAVLSVIWDTEEGWLPDAEVTEGWYFDSALVMVNLAKAMQTENTLTALMAFKEIADEYATWLQTILAFQSEGEVIDGEVEQAEDAQ